MQPGQIALVTARDLGARGSRSQVGSAEPRGTPVERGAGGVGGRAVVVGTAGDAVGLTGRWSNVHTGLELPPCPGADGVAVAPPVGVERWEPHMLGAAYVSALDPGVRSRHGRHYTPDTLATELWAMTQRALGRRTPPAAPLPGLVRDPASGAGSLLIPALREHLTASLVRRPSRGSSSPGCRT